MIRKFLSKPVLAVDLETNGLKWTENEIAGVSISDGLYSKYYKWPLVKSDNIALEELLNKPITKIFHNAKFDLHFLLNHFQFPEGMVEDTMIMSYLIDETGSHKLKDLAVRHLDPRAKDSQEALQDWMKANKVNDFSKVPFAMLSHYAELDAFYTFKLWEYFKPKINENCRELAETEHKLLWTTIKMERRGVFVDVDHLAKQSDSLIDKANAIVDEVGEVIGKAKINLASNEEVGKYLIDQGIEVPLSEKNGKPLMDKWFLDKVNHPVAKLVKDWRQISHIEATYCSGLPERVRDVQDGKGVIHCNFRQIGVVTGRFSCADPNLQNIPRDLGGIRKGFIVRPGYRNFYFDYSQVEMRILAHYAKEQEMIEAFKKGKDLHALTASKLLKKPVAELTKENRYIGKHLNFAILYGMGANGFAKKFEVTKEEANSFMTEYFESFPMVRAFRNIAWRRVADHGRIKNLFGRVRHLANNEGYKAVNALIQSTAADLLKVAMTRVDTLLYNTESHIIMQIHDELVIEIAEGEESLIPKIKIALTKFPEFRVPMIVDVQYTETNWAEKKDWRGDE